MEPRIQYARTEDGVNIAYGVFGEGLPLIYTPSAHSIGVHYYTYLSYSRRTVDQLTEQSFQVARYDGRGTGSSDRSATEFSLETDVLDLQAVADRLGYERFTLVGHFAGAQAAIAYATRWPERVSHLVLRDPWPSGRDMYQMFPGNRVLAAMRPFAEQQWDLVCINIAAVGFGLTDDVSKEYAAAVRSGITPATWVKIGEATDDCDVTDLLGSVSVPTLVVLDTALPGRPPNTIAEWSAPVKKVAASIPNARLVSTGDLGAAVSEFVRGSSHTPAPATAARSPGGLQTLLFTDVEGSTALTHRMGDAAARDVLREHERITREALKTHGGSEVKTMGDGFMASFGSATRALECAIAIQRAFDVGARQPLDDESSREASSVASPLRAAIARSFDNDIRVRIGLNAGEPIAEDDPGGRSDLYGTAVIVAARIAAQANGREILVSDVVRQLVAGKGFLFSDRGDHALKGFEDPVRVYEVRWRES